MMDANSYLADGRRSREGCLGKSGQWRVDCSPLREHRFGRTEVKIWQFRAENLPAASLQHLSFVQGADGEALHRPLQVFADLK